MKIKQKKQKTKFRCTSVKMLFLKTKNGLNIKFLLSMATLITSATLLSTFSCPFCTSSSR